jgi:hypothetical protein
MTTQLVSQAKSLVARVLASCRFSEHIDRQRYANTGRQSGAPPLGANVPACLVRSVASGRSRSHVEIDGLGWELPAACNFTRYKTKHAKATRFRLFQQSFLSKKCKL